MARQALTPSCLTLVQALETHVPLALEKSGLDQCRIGLSGGADSLAMTAAMAWVRDHRQGPLAGVKLEARIVDHQLQNGSADVASQAQYQAQDLGVLAEITPVNVDITQGGLEAAAREQRYAALHEGGPALILVAHTMDDQAETVLLGLARGSGTRSLSGMTLHRDHICRPFLEQRRATTEQACTDWGLSWWVDPSNGDPAYSRSRVRQTIPMLESALGPGVVQGLARTASLCRIDADYLDVCTSEVDINVNDSQLEVTTLIACDPAIRHRILLAWLRGVGSDAVARDHVLAVDALVTDWHGQKSICVPGGRVTRVAGVLRLLSEAAAV